MPSATASISAAQLMPRNGLRQSWSVTNEDATNVLFIKKEREGATVSSTDHDYRIAVASSFSLNLTLDGLEAIQDRWTVVSDGGTPRYSFVETESVKR